MNVTWVVQTNMGGHYTEDLMSACKNLGLKFIADEVIPFSDNLPNVPNRSPTIFYGATRWINNIYENNIWSPGVFFNPESVFTLWRKKYGIKTLNWDGRVTTLNKLASQPYDSERLLFIRPVSDQKEFAGNVMPFKEIKEWDKRIQTDVPDFGNLPIVVAEPVGISHEWRLFVVNGKISSGSHYREHQKLTIHSDIPKEVIEFAEKRIKEYSPAPVFVMDIGQSVNLYVIEIGCFNSAGFYATDVEKVVCDVSKFISENY